MPCHGHTRPHTQLPLVQAQALAHVASGHMFGTLGTPAPARCSPPNPPTPYHTHSPHSLRPPFPLPAGRGHPADVIAVAAARQARCMHRIVSRPSLGPSRRWMWMNRKMSKFRMSTITSDRVIPSCPGPDTACVGPRTIGRPAAAVQIAAVLSQVPFNTTVAVFSSDLVPYARSVFNEHIFTEL